MKSASWTLRLEKKELTDWRKQAAKERMSLSAWIRQRCNARIPRGMVEINATVEKLRRLLDGL
jgi:hypothetical protein